MAPGVSQVIAGQKCHTEEVVTPQRVAAPGTAVVCGSATAESPALLLGKNVSTTTRHGELYGKIGKRYLKGLKVLVLEALKIVPADGKVVVLADPRELQAAVTTINDSIRIGQLGSKNYVVPNYVQEFWLSNGRCPEVVNALKDIFNPEVLIECDKYECVARRGRGSVLTCGDVESNPGPPNPAAVDGGVFCRAASNGKQSPETVKAAAEVLSGAQVLNEWFRDVRNQGRYGALRDAIIGLLRGGKGSGESLRVEFERFTEAVCGDACPRADCDPDGPRPDCLQCDNLRGITEQLRAACECYARAASRDRRQTAAAGVICSARRSARVCSASGDSNAIPPGKRVSVPLENQNAAVASKLGVCRYVRDAWLEISVRHCGEMQNGGEMAATDIARYIARRANPEEVETVYTSAASVAHPYCVSDGCEHEFAVALLSSAWYACSTELAREESRVADVDVQCKTVGDDDSGSCVQEDEPSDGETFILGGRSCDTYSSVEVLAHPETSQPASVLKHSSTEEAVGGVITRSTDVSRIHSEDTEYTCHVETNCASGIRKVTFAKESNKSREEGVVDVRSAHGHGTISGGRDGLPAHGISGRFDAPQFCPSEEGLHVDLQLAHKPQPPERFVTAAVGGSVGSLRTQTSTDARRESIQESPIDAAAEYMRTFEANASCPSSLLSRSMGPQRLRSQRDAWCQVESVGGSTAATGECIRTSVEPNQHSIEPSCITISDVPGGFDIAISPEQASAISQRFGYTIGVWLDGAGLAHISFCKVREVGSLQDRQRPACDTSPRHDVQHDVRNVYESNRNGPLLPERSSADDAINSQGDEFFHEGPHTPPPMEFVRRSSKCELRPIEMGHALQLGSVQDNARQLPESYEGSTVRSAVASAATQQGLYKAPHSVRGGMRGHEWRYDNSTGQLLCSSCHHHSLPGAVKRRCLQARRNSPEGKQGHCPSYPASVTRNSKFVQCGGSTSVENVESRSVATGATTRLVRYPGRRRRSRVNVQSQTCTTVGDNVAHVVEDDGTQVDSGTTGGESERGDILSTQTAASPRSVDNDARSNEDDWQVVGRKRRLPKQSKALLENRVQNASGVAQWNASARANVLPTIQSRTWTRNERKEHTPVISGTGVAMVQATTPANEHIRRARTPDEMLTDVGSQRGAAGGAREHSVGQLNTCVGRGSAHRNLDTSRTGVTYSAARHLVRNSIGELVEDKARVDETPDINRGGGLPPIRMREYYRHPHICSWCKREYTHTHHYYRKDHKDLPNQCPYSSCSSYHKGNNKTSAATGRGSLLTCGDVEVNPGPCDKCRGAKLSMGIPCPKCKRCTFSCCNCWVSETTNKDINWYSKKEKRVIDLCTHGDVESNPGPGPTPVASQAPKPRKRRVRQKVTQAPQAPVPQPRRQGRGRLSAVIPRPIGTYIRQTRLPMPELTHNLQEHEMTFLRRIMSPGSEKSKFDANVRVPDGALPNSAAIGLREMETFVCPFRVAGDALSTTLQWTLIYLRLPLLKLYAIFIAVDQQGELSSTQEIAVKDFLNSSPGAIPQYPAWADVEASVKVCGLYWEQLSSISLDPYEETRLISQFRHCNYSATMYFNTPDLVNQGVCIGGQWNLDIKRTTLTGTPDAADQTTIETQGWMSLERTTAAILDSGAAQTPNGGQLSPFQVYVPTGTITFTGFPNGITYNSATDVVIVSGGFNLNNNQSGTVNMLNGPTTTVTTGFEYRYIYVLRQVSATESQIYYGIVTRDVDTGTNIDQFSASQGSMIVSLITAAIVTYPIDLTWILAEAVDSMERYQIVLPPLRNKSIVQSTPKFVMYLMKGTAGWYQVNRVFQPVFNLQEADTQRHIRFAVAGSTGQNQSEYLSVGGLVDTYDLNFSVGVVVMSGMSYTASPTFKFVSDIEIVADEGSPWQTNMMETTERCDQVIGVARTMMDSQPFLYPEYYNSMGVILDGIGKLLGGLPIISNVMPVVSKFMSSVMGKPSDTPMNNGTHQNVEGADVGELIRAILAKLAK